MATYPQRYRRFKGALLMGVARYFLQQADWVHRRSHIPGSQKPMLPVVRVWLRCPAFLLSILCVICMVTALVIVISGTCVEAGIEGVNWLPRRFDPVFRGFLCVIFNGFLFAYSP
ncbi:MAG: hypothetical protein IPH22_13370 [Nitrosomonas sp.]|nr:hypothetical protein [Nitrosomonas sp.]